MERLSMREKGSRVPLTGLPLGREGSVKDVANASVFLFSDAASFITGQVLVVDGAHESVRGSMLPYPQSVLDPESVKHLMKPKL